MRNLLLIIVLFAFGSFVNAQTLVSHNINNLTNGGLCGGYEFFASFDNTDDCNPSAGMPCFDVPHGVTNHDSRDQSCNTFTNISDVKAMTLKVVSTGQIFVISFCDPSGNQLLNGGAVLFGLGSCYIPSPIAYVNVYWTIDPVSNLIDITIV